MSIKANGNSDRDETDCQRQMQVMQALEVFFIGIVIPSLSTQDNVDHRQTQREPGHRMLVDFLEHGINLEEIDAGVHEGEEERNRSEGSRFTLRLLREQGRNRKDHEEQRGEGNGQVDLASAVELRIPSDVEQQCADVAEDEQSSPGLAGDHYHGGYVEHGKIREEL